MGVLHVIVGDHVGLALMHVHRTGVDAGVGCCPVDRAQNTSRGPLDNSHRFAGATKGDVVGGSFGSRPEPPARASAQQPTSDQYLEQATHARPEELPIL